MPIDFLYPTPFYYSNVDDYSGVKEEVDLLVDNSDFDYHPEWGNNHKLSDPTFSQNPVLYMEKTRSEIQTHIGRYLQAIKFHQSLEYTGAANYTVVSSWLSQFDKGEYAHVHSHAHHEISGVYYHQVKGDQGQFFVESPVPQMTSSFVFNHMSQSLKISPTPGMILLFPGYLYHGVYANQTDDVRISLSFNVSFQKPYFS